jgi:threonine dehydrogenase-like Zn-dependent dehydrogenase
VRLNMPVAVLGAGSVAMSMCFFARLAGAYPLIVVGRRDDSLERMRRFGADVLINNAREDAAAAVRKATGGRGVDRIIDTTGAARLVAGSFGLLSAEGTVGPYATYDLPEEMKGLDQSRIGAYQTGEVPAHEYMMDLARMGLLPLRSFYSHRMPFAKITEGFRMLAQKQAFKIVFDMGGDA